MHNPCTQSSAVHSNKTFLHVPRPPPRPRTPPPPPPAGCPLLNIPVLNNGAPSAGCASTTPEGKRCNYTCSPGFLGTPYTPAAECRPGGAWALLDGACTLAGAPRKVWALIQPRVK